MAKIMIKNERTDKELENNVNETQETNKEETTMEKKKFDWKGFGKKVLKVTGAAAGAAVVGGIGYLVGKNHKDNADSTPVEGPVYYDNEQEEYVEEEYSEEE